MWIALCIGSAFLYVSSSVFMKYWNELGATFAVLGIALTMLAAIGVEILALRYQDLSITMVMIIGLEAVIAVVWGFSMLGEAIAVQKIAGLGLIVAGIAMLKLDKVILLASAGPTPAG